jgi:hypothetical protein
MIVILLAYNEEKLPLFSLAQPCIVEGSHVCGYTRGRVLYCPEDTSADEQEALLGNNAHRFEDAWRAKFDSYYHLQLYCFLLAKVALV